MPTISYRTFSGGEFAPSLYPRADLAKHSTALRTLRNFFVMRHGGASNRPGSIFSGHSKAHLGSIWAGGQRAIRLVPFVFNAEQTYMLEFGVGYVRFIKEGDYLSDLQMTITNITTAGTAVVTYTGTNPANGDEIKITGVNGMKQINNRNFIIINLNTGAKTFELRQIGTGNNPLSTLGYDAYTSGGVASRIYEVTTGITEDELAGLTYAQSADILSVAGHGIGAFELRRLAETNWQWVGVTFAPVTPTPTGISASGGPGTTVLYRYYVTAVDDATGEESLAAEVQILAADPSSSTIEVTWNAVAGTTTYNVYRGVVHRPSFVLGQVGLIGISEGLAFSDDGAFEPDFSESPPISRNPVSLFGDPATVTYAQQRRIYAGFVNDEERVEASVIGHYYNFTRRSPIQEDDNVSFSLAGKTVNRIKHLLDLNSLVMFTSGGEHEARGNEAGIITPTQVNTRQHSYNGSGNVAPLVLNNNALYLQNRGSIVRDLGYTFESDGYKGNDLTVFSSHLFDGFTIVDWAYSQVPHSIVWAVRDDGVLLGLTYNREHDMLAWHRHDFDDGEVVNVASIPEGNEDILYLAINRTIDGESRKFIERFSTRLISDVVDAKFMDSCITYDGRNTGATTMKLQPFPPVYEQLDESSSTQIGSSQEKGVRFVATKSVIGNIPNQYQITPDTLKLKLNRGPDTAGTVYVEIRSGDGTSLLATSDVKNVSSLQTTPTVETFTFASPPTLLEGVQYSFVLRAPGWSGIGGYGSLKTTGFGSNDLSMNMITMPTGTNTYSDSPSTDVYFQLIETEPNDPGNAAYLVGDHLILIADASTFDATNVGNAFQVDIVDDDGVRTDRVICTVLEYISDTRLRVTASKDIPDGLKNTEVTDWAYAVDEINGLWHIEGQNVSVFADGFVLGSPKNPNYNLIPVTDGAITLDNPFAVIQIGLPYLSDIETLDIDSPESSLVDQAKMVGAVTLGFEDSRGGFVGPKPPSDDAVDPLEYLDEIKTRQFEAMEDPVALKTDQVEVVIRPEWNSNGRVFVRQIDPLPMSILSISPSGKLGRA